MIQFIMALPLVLANIQYMIEIQIVFIFAIRLEEE